MVLGAAWLASFLFPPERLDSLPPLCLWKTLSGVPCPFCGLTHSVVALSHGQFRAAFELNPFGPVVYLSGIVLLAITAFILLRGGPPSVGQRLGRALRIVAITVPVLWALWWLAATAGILPR